MGLKPRVRQHPFPRYLLWIKHHTDAVPSRSTRAALFPCEHANVPTRVLPLYLLRWFLTEASASSVKHQHWIHQQPGCWVTSEKGKKPNETATNLNYCYRLPGQRKVSFQKSTEVPLFSQTLRKLQFSFQHYSQMWLQPSIFTASQVRFRPKKEASKGKELPEVLLQTAAASGSAPRIKHLPLLKPKS